MFADNVSSMQTPINSVSEKNESDNSACPSDKMQKNPPSGYLHSHLSVLFNKLSYAYILARHSECHSGPTRYEHDIWQQ